MTAPNSNMASQELCEQLTHELARLDTLVQQGCDQSDPDWTRSDTYADIKQQIDTIRAQLCSTTTNALKTPTYNAMQARELSYELTVEVTRLDEFVHDTLCSDVWEPSTTKGARYEALRRRMRNIARALDEYPDRASS